MIGWGQTIPIMISSLSPYASHPSHELIYIAHCWLTRYEYLIIIDDQTPYVIAYCVEERRCGLLSPHTMSVELQDEFIRVLSELVGTGRVIRPIVWCSQKLDSSRAHDAADLRTLNPLSVEAFTLGTVDDIDGHLYEAAAGFAADHARARAVRHPAPPKRLAVDMSFRNRAAV